MKKMIPRTDHPPAIAHSCDTRFDPDPGIIYIATINPDIKTASTPTIL